MTYPAESVHALFDVKSRTGLDSRLNTYFQVDRFYLDEVIQRVDSSVLFFSLRDRGQPLAAGYKNVEPVLRGDDVFAFGGGAGNSRYWLARLSETGWRIVSDDAGDYFRWIVAEAKLVLAVCDDVRALEKRAGRGRRWTADLAAIAKRATSQKQVMFLYAGQGRVLHRMAADSSAAQSALGGARNQATFHSVFVEGLLARSGGVGDVTVDYTGAAFYVPDAMSVERGFLKDITEAAAVDYARAAGDVVCTNRIGGGKGGPLPALPACFHGICEKMAPDDQKMLVLLDAVGVIDVQEGTGMTWSTIRYILDVLKVPKTVRLFVRDVRRGESNQQELGPMTNEEAVELEVHLRNRSVVLAAGQGVIGDLLYVLARQPGVLGIHDLQKWQLGQAAEVDIWGGTLKVVTSRAPSFGAKRPWDRSLRQGAVAVLAAAMAQMLYLAQPGTSLHKMSQQPWYDEVVLYAVSAAARGVYTEQTVHEPLVRLPVQLQEKRAMGYRYRKMLGFDLATGQFNATAPVLSRVIVARCYFPTPTSVPAPAVLEVDVESGGEGRPRRLVVRAGKEGPIIFSEPIAVAFGRSFVHGLVLAGLYGGQIQLTELHQYPCKWEGCAAVLDSTTTLYDHLDNMHSSWGVKWICKWRDCPNPDLFKDHAGLMVARRQDHLNSHAHKVISTCTRCGQEFQSVKWTEEHRKRGCIPIRLALGPNAPQLSDQMLGMARVPEDTIRKIADTLAAEHAARPMTGREMNTRSWELFHEQTGAMAHDGTEGESMDTYADTSLADSEYADRVDALEKRGAIIMAKVLEDAELLEDVDE